MGVSLETLKICTIMNKNRLNIIASISLTLLLIPLIAMQFTDEVNWTISDFMVAAVLLIGTGYAIDLVFRKVKATQMRVIFSIAILAMLILVWLELAVGIFGTPFAGD